ncbi:MAG: hypothetical protein DMG98_11530 [Acidobacteria bacterium]|nr:MAG: hypothetical protein DMG98_11530 [Acidobacteriota bacterium]
MLVRAVIFFSGNVAAVVCRNESPAQTSPHPLERGTGTQIQTMTIQRKLLGLTITGLAFVLAISATGYWGITTVEETTAPKLRPPDRPSAIMLRPESIRHDPV